MASTLAELFKEDFVVSQYFYNLILLLTGPCSRMGMATCGFLAASLLSLKAWSKNDMLVTEETSVKGLSGTSSSSSSILSL